MKKLTTLIIAASLLSGCVGLESLARIGNTVCEREEASRLALDLAEDRAVGIVDDTRRAAALAAIRASRAVLDACPEKL